MLQLSAWLLAVLLTSAWAHAAGAEDGWGVEAVDLRYATYLQRGRGAQSVATPDAEGRGSEKLEVYAPSARVALRQNARTTHTITFPMDIVSSASTDALDASTSASRWNEAGSLDITSQIELGESTDLSVRYGGHLEETLRSGFGGVQLTQGFAQENSTLALGVNAVYDHFEDYRQQNRRFDELERVTLGFGAGFTQVLSMTTLLQLNYDLTLQRGTLRTPWNTVAIQDSAQRLDEDLPGQRNRHAAALTVLQHLPQTRSTLRLGYRYYFDTFDLRAHTMTFAFSQYLAAPLVLRLRYRFHTQNAVKFFRSRADLPAENLLLTADSDLEDFEAHSAGLKLHWRFGGTGDFLLDGHYVYGAYDRYWRTNSLNADLIATGYGYRF